MREAKDKRWPAGLRALAVLATATTIGFSGAAIADTGEAKIRINVRDGMGTDFPIVTTLSAGQEVDILDYDGEFVRIRTAGGSEGYLKQKYLNVTKDMIAAPEPIPAPAPEPMVAPEPAPAPVAQAPAPAPAPAASASSDDATQLSKVLVTGSAIRRIAGEGPLPVQVIDRAAIDRTGASSVVDLLQKLPVIQGGVAEAEAVGGSTYGFAGVSIHDIGETRTLVLLNGRRMAQFGGQTLTGFGAAMDINSLPIAAIERVEILKDGASAIYGSDAVAGVVNFITKDSTTEGDLSFSYYSPADGAQEWGVSLSKGFGDYDKDGWNVFMTLSADSRDKLKSTDRSFAGSGFVDFSANGYNYRFINDSPSPIPGNILVDNPNSVLDGQVASIPLLQGQSCEGATGYSPYWGDFACGYDYVQTLEIYPKRERQTGIVSFNMKLAEDHNLFADLLYSRSEQESAIAPVPGSFLIEAGTDLWNTYFPGLNGPDGVQVVPDGEDAFILYRVFDLGNRRTMDTNTFYQAVLGLEGFAAGWDYNVALTQSESDVKGDISGYPGTNAFVGLLGAGLLDPFVGPGQQSAEGQAALNAINYNGYWDGGTSTLNTLSAQGSRELFEFGDANVVNIAVGATWQNEEFQSKPSEFAQANLDDPVAGTPAAGGPGTGDQRFGDAAAFIPYSADRDLLGIFTEVGVMVGDSLELVGSLRYDDYSDVGDTTNHKFSVRWTPLPGLLARASFGTGFKAPTVPQLNASQQTYGVTAAGYPCTADLQQIADSVGGECRPGNSQYDVFAGGNSALTPEESDQYSIGFVAELPTFGLLADLDPAVSLSVDYWNVEIEDAFGQISEGEAFGNPLRYPGSWTTAIDPGTGRNFLAYIQGNVNLGKEKAEGIDFDGQLTLNTPVGKVGSQLVGTLFLTRDIEILGETYDLVGDYSDELGSVTFRLKARWINSIEMGDWRHSLTMNFTSGYSDAEQYVDDYVFELDASGEPVLGGASSGDTIRLDVDRYITWDLQTYWDATDAVSVSAGVLNLLDEDPPLTLAIDAGHPVGYDLRYADPRGRVLYAKVSYKF